MLNSIELINLGIRENQIRLDYSKANAAADQLEDIANNLVKLNNGEFENTSTGIRLAWEGENANMFLGKYALTREEIIKTASDINTTAEKVRVMAQNTYDAEMQAIQVARDRINGTT